MPVKIDLGQVMQGVVLIVLGFILLVVWFLASVLSPILPFGIPQSILSIGVVLFLAGIAIALIGFSYRRRSR